MIRAARLLSPVAGLVPLPAALFAASEKGVWYDPSDLSTVWQDDAGTTPGAVGQVVGRIDDKSGNGYNATQSTTGNKPILRQNATTGAYYLEFDGVDDYLVTASVDLSATDEATVFAGLTKEDDATIAVLVEPYNAGVPTNKIALFAPRQAASLDYGFQSGGTAVVDVLSGSTAETAVVLTGQSNISADSATLRLNGTQVGSSGGDQGTGNYGNYAFHIGHRGGDTLPFQGRVYGLIIRGALSSAAEITSTERWLATRVGVVL